MKICTSNIVNALRIVFTGDLVHSKNQMTPELIEMVRWLLLECSFIAPTIIIPGNHDFLVNNIERLDALTPIINSLNNTDFPNVQSYGIKANIINSDGQYQIRLAIWDPIEGKWNNDIPFPRNKFVSKEGVAPALITMSDAAIYELLNDVPPSAAELQKLKQANKKPL